MSSGSHSPYGGAGVSGTAPHTFTAGATGGQVSSSVVFEWDLDNDGDFDDPLEDITSYVLSAETTTGRDFPSNLTGLTGPGKLRMTLLNDDDRFSYFNTASPLNAGSLSLKTGRKIRVRTSEQTLGAADITYVGIGAIAAGSNASLAPALPTGLQSAETASDNNADLMVIVAAIRNSGTGTVNTPSGWAPLLTSGNLTVLGKYYEDGDVAPTVTFTGGVANATTVAQCFALRGCHQILSQVLATSASQLNASAQNMAVPGLVAAAISGRLADPDDVTMVVIGWKQDDWTSVAQLSGQLFTEISDSPSLLGDDAGLEIQYRLGGFSGGKTFTGTNLTVTGGASAISRTMVLAFCPAIDHTDPVLIVRDRFGRANNPALGTAETSQTWTARANGGFSLVSSSAAVPELRDTSNTNVDIISTVDTTATDHYVQASFPMQVQDGRVGLVVRYSDNSNYTRAYYDTEDRALIVEDVAAGVATILTTFLIEAWDGMTVGAGVVNQTLTLYLGGFPLSTDTLPGSIAGTHAGLYGRWQTHSDVAPRVDDFYVWDRVRTPIDGVLWTGYVKNVVTQVNAGSLKVVQLDAEGPLSAAAVAEVPAPRIVRTVGEHDVGNHSVPAGAIVGDVMARAGLLHPPYPIDGEDTSHIGPMAVDDGKALDLARLVEATERGLILESPEGAVGFQDRSYRDTVASSAWFTDTPGSGQFGYSAIVPLDHQNQIFNRVTAQVAATCPTVVAVENQDFGLLSMDINVVIPDVEPDDLLIVFIVSSGDPTFDWLVPHTWEMHNQTGTFQGLRCYTHICDGTESGTTVQFYTSTEVGNAIAHIYTVRDWYGTNDGLKLSRGSYAVAGSSGGEDAYPLEAWDRSPALYIVVQDVIGASVGGILWGPLSTPPPVGYDYLSLEGLVTVSPGNEGYDIGIESIYKVDILDTENPREWSGVFADFTVLRETHVFAVRGYNGPLGKATIDDSGAIGSDGWFVTLNDLDSQFDHNVIRSNPDPPQLFYTEPDARDYCEAVLAEFSDDRPIIQLTFYASKNTGLRAQARNRRVSDKVTVTASGNAGLGIASDFFIESINHKWSNGTRLWVTTWELSPA